MMIIILKIKGIAEGIIAEVCGGMPSLSTHTGYQTLVPPFEGGGRR